MYHVNAVPISVASSCFGLVAQENGGVGRWIVLVAGFGGPDEIKCYASTDVEDPTEIPKMSWTCESNSMKASSCRFFHNALHETRFSSSSAPEPILFHRGRVVFLNVTAAVTPKHEMIKATLVTRPTPRAVLSV